MPATDWREITYSRLHLRPNDGLDPEVRPLRRKAVELARKKQIPAYMQAQRNLEEAEQRELAIKEKIRADEVTRQSRERESLVEALKMRAGHFDELWAHQRKEMEAEVEHKRRGFEDKVEGQMNALELAIEQKAKKNMKLYKGSRHPPVIYSSLVRDDRMVEFRQAQAGNMQLAIRYHQSLKDQMQREKSQHLENCEHQIDRRRKLLKEKLEVERKDMEDACDRIRLAFEQKYAIAVQKQKQNVKNLSHDNEHAMALEWGAPKEVRASLSQSRTQPKSYQSRPKTSSTFMGRNLMEKAGRGSMDVPSVCKMESRDGMGVFVGSDGKKHAMAWEPLAETPRFDNNSKSRRPQTAAH